MTVLDSCFGECGNVHVVACSVWLSECVCAGNIFRTNKKIKIKLARYQERKIRKKKKRSSNVQRSSTMF